MQQGRKQGPVSLAIVAVGLSSLVSCSASDGPIIGHASEAIVNGTATTGDPAVGLFIGPRHRCSGTLIHPRAVLSAAHCAQAFGTFNIGSSDASITESIPVESYVLHPSWTGLALGDLDLAVVILKHDASVPAVPLLRTAAPIGVPVRLVGFGTAGLASDAEIKRTGWNEYDYADPRYLRIMVGSSAGVCFGDSGGPTFCPTPNGEQICGVHSATSREYGAPPCSLASYDAPIDEALQWIDSLMPERVPPPPPTKCMITQWVCTRSPSRTDTFVDDLLPESSTDPARCMERAAEYSRWCGNPAGAVTFARYWDNSTLVDERSHYAGGCRVELPACASYPEREGMIDEAWQGSDTDETRCLQRAGEYNAWCGNTGGVEVVASFYAGGALISEAVHRADGCRIRLQACSRDPDRQRVFGDSYQGADTDPDRCAQRAEDWNRWCDNPVATRVTADFLSDNEVVASAYHLADGCRIYQPECPNHPSDTGFFVDTVPEARTDPARCGERAAEHSRWCGAPPGAKTEAYFYAGGVLADATFYLAPGCRIDQATCKNSPDTVGTFGDDYQDAGTDEARCLRRAGDYARWCGNTTGQATHASFYADGLPGALTTYYVPGCLITQRTCTLQPTYVDSFPDFHPDSPTDEARCLSRAEDFARWCGNPVGVATTASYFEASARLGSFTYTR